MIERGHEGYVAKDEASARTRGWRTTRCPKVTQKGWMVEEDGWRRISFHAAAPAR